MFAMTIRGSCFTHLCGERAPFLFFIEINLIQSMQIIISKYQGPDGLYYLKLQDYEGKTILQCTGCKSAADSTSCLIEIRRAAASEAQYQRSSTTDGKWFFSLRSPEGRTIAVSSQFGSQQEMERAIAELRSGI